MGLFGPSWSWEEIQRKDALERDLRKENDRVLREQERMLRENNTNSYDAERAAAGRRIASRVASERKLYRYLYNSYCVANVINKDYINGYLKLKIKSKDFTMNERTKGGLYSKIFIIGVIFLILGYITTFKTNPMGLIELLIFFLVILFLIRFIPAIMNHKKMIANDCYQKIKSEINPEDIIEIGIIEDRVRILQPNGYDDYLFADYGYNDMPMNLQSIFLASLIEDLGLKFKIYLNTEYDGIDNDIFDNLKKYNVLTCNEAELGIASYNKIYFIAMSKEQLKINKNKFKEQKKNPNGLKKW